MYKGSRKTWSDHIGEADDTAQYTLIESALFERDDVGAKDDTGGRDLQAQLSVLVLLLVS